MKSKYSHALSTELTRMVWCAWPSIAPGPSMMPTTPIVVATSFDGAQPAPVQARRRARGNVGSASGRIGDVAHLVERGDERQRRRVDEVDAGRAARSDRGAVGEHLAVAGSGQDDVRQGQHAGLGGQDRPQLPLAVALVPLDGVAVDARAGRDLDVRQRRQGEGRERDRPGMPLFVRGLELQDLAVRGDARHVGQVAEHRDGRGGLRRPRVIGSRRRRTPTGRRSRAASSATGWRTASRCKRK